MFQSFDILLYLMIYELLNKEMTIPELWQNPVRNQLYKCGCIWYLIQIDDCDTALADILRPNEAFPSTSIVDLHANGKQTNTFHLDRAKALLPPLILTDVSLTY